MAEEENFCDRTLEYLAEKPYRFPAAATVIGSIAGAATTTAMLGLAEMAAVIYSYYDRNVSPNPTYETTAFIAASGAMIGACAFVITLAEEVYIPWFEDKINEVDKGIEKLLRDIQPYTMLINLGKNTRKHKT